MITVASVGDIHLGTDSRGRFRAWLEGIAERADLFLLAGDLTKRGEPDEATVVAHEVGGLGIPTIAVLGNHDYHVDEQARVTDILEHAGIRVLEGEAEVVEVRGARVGVAGTKGFGGGFAGACGSEFGEPEMKAFVRHTQVLADGLEAALGALDADHRIALMHYAPVRETLSGEPPEIYPFLGSHLLGAAVDRAGADLVLHGHAHHGAEKGVTPGGVLVRNVAQNVIRHGYNLYTLGAAEEMHGLETASAGHPSDAF